MQDVVVSFLSRFSGRKVSYYAGGGNAGDSLIASGTYGCLDKLSINYEAINEGDSPRPGVVIFAGGGNFVPLYDYIRKGILKHNQTAEELIVLPHTIRGNEDLLWGLDKKVTLFCREVASYEHCLRHAKQANVVLAHDMAFHANVMELLSDPNAQREFRSDYEARVARYPTFGEKVASGAPIHFMRNDIEKAQRGIKSDMDVSEVFMGSLSDRESVRKSTWGFLMALKSAHSIVTDRLHVGIGAALLGVPCELIDNSYGKNREIYDFSLANRFHNITFRSEKDIKVNKKKTDDSKDAFTTLALTYCLTKQANLIERMKKAIKAQTEIDEYFGRKCPYNRILITDAAYNELPAEFLEFFDDFKCNVEAFYFDHLVNKSYFSLSQVRNAALSFASRNHFEWVLLCDSDTIFATYEFSLPLNGYGVPEVYWQKSESETPMQSLDVVSKPGPDTFSKGNSWFLIRQDIFSRVKFNENIFGYGFEDREFDLRVQALGHKLVSTDLCIIHQFHPHSERKVDSYIYGRNKTIFDYSLALSKRNALSADQDQFGTFYAKHPHWQGFLILYFDRRRLINVGQGTGGSFQFEGNKLRIAWDKFPPEVFVFTGSSFDYTFPMT